MKFYKRALKYGSIAVGVVGGLLPLSSLAQLTAPTSAGATAFFGVNTSGAETGVYEIAALVPLGIAVLVGIVIAFAAYMLVRRFIRGAGSGG